MGHVLTAELSYDRRFTLSQSVLDLLITRLESYLIKEKSVRTSQETHDVPATKTNRLMLFRETVAVCCENHMEHTNTLCVQNVELFNVKVDGTYNNHCVLKGLHVEKIQKLEHYLSHRSQTLTSRGCFMTDYS
jgi:hypothetical protein